MSRQRYVGLGSPQQAVVEFEALTPHVERLMALQHECGNDVQDRYAFGIALKAIESAAYHFTRRPHFYHRLEGRYPWPNQPSNGRLKDVAEAIREFEALAPYRDRLRKLEGKCAPFGRDHLALGIAVEGLHSTAYHFTRIPDFYACGDASRPARPKM